MSRRHYEFPVRSRTVAFDLELDEARPNHRSLLSFLSQKRFYEPDISQFLLKVVEPGDTVIDIGANIGFFAVLAGALVGPQGRVYAFEPGANNLPELHHNLTLNSFSHVEVIDKPVSNCIEAVSFFLNSDNSGGNALWNPADYPGNTKSQEETIAQAMTSTTLDAFSERLSPTTLVKLVKIDTEGAEHKVLTGAHRFLRRHAVPFVIAELHEFGLRKMGASAESLRALMRDLGYETFVLLHDGSLPKFVPTGTRIASKYIRNVVFTRPDALAAHFESEYFA